MLSDSEEMFVFMYKLAIKMHRTTWKIISNVSTFVKMLCFCIDLYMPFIVSIIKIQFKKPIAESLCL